MQQWALNSYSSHDRNQHQSVGGRSVYLMNHQHLRIAKKGKSSCSDCTWVQVISNTGQPRTNHVTCFRKYQSLLSRSCMTGPDRPGIRVVVKRTSAVSGSILEHSKHMALKLLLNVLLTWVLNTVSEFDNCQLLNLTALKQNERTSNSEKAIATDEPVHLPSPLKHSQTCLAICVHWPCFYNMVKTSWRQNQFCQKILQQYGYFIYTLLLTLQSFVARYIFDVHIFDALWYPITSL